MAAENKKSTLSPVPYLKHNKGRTAALIVSLSVFTMMIYVLGYLLGSTLEPFTRVLVDPYRQYTLISPEIEDFEYENIEEWDEIIDPMLHEKRDEAARILGTDDIFIVRRGYANINAILGESSTAVYYFENTSDMERYAQLMEATLVSGRMPQAPGELVVDRKCIANAGEKLLSKIAESYTVVGEVDSPYYLVFGLTLPAENNRWLMAFNGSGDSDYVRRLEESGMRISGYQDLGSAQAFVDNDIGVLTDISKIFSIVSGVILGICILVVLSLHIKDRHEEWCLLNSIGFPVGEIYMMGTLELLICFGVAAVAGGILSGIVVFLMKIFMMDPMGLPVRMLRTEEIAMILIMYLAVFALCQIPMFIRMRAITTVDDIE